LVTEVEVLRDVRCIDQIESQPRPLPGGGVLQQHDGG
jgi:hypothetical protein